MLKPILILFWTSFSLMVVEILVGRMMAPYLGVSLYTWTSVISVILFGMAVGNYVGGRLADRQNGYKQIGFTLFLSGSSIVFSNYILMTFGESLALLSLPLWFKSIFFSLVIFFPAAALLAMVHPQLIKLALSLEHTIGRTTGKMYASSALGSILGTFGAGFLFISTIGSKRTASLIAISLFAIGLFLIGEYHWLRHRYTLIGVLFILSDLWIPGVCKKETNYYCIRVTQQTQNNATFVVLRLDHMVHSYVQPNMPEKLGYEYEQVHANMLAYWRATHPSFSAFFIGGGGYVLPRYVEWFYPESTSTVAEIDPGVTVANHAWLKLPKTTAIRTYPEDARMHLARTTSTYDLVFGDAFNDFSVPYHLTTREFHTLLKSRMRPDGIYALNLIDDPAHGQFMSAMIRTLGEVWKHVSVAPQAQELRPGRNTIVLMASDAPIDLELWQNAPLPPALYDAIQSKREVLTLLDEEKIQAFLKGHSAPMLRDDFVPIDRYLSPVFIDAY